MSIPSVKEARAHSNANQRTEVTSAVVKLSGAIGEAIKGAADRGLHMAEVAVDPKIGEGTLGQVQASLASMGYMVSVQRKYGFLATNLYLQPKVILKVLW